jgi:pyruvate,water dikinase
LGVDRDSTTVAPLFDERNEAVTWSCARVISAAHSAGCKVGICGQAPSDFPDFAAFLVEQGIDSISLSPDALARTLRRIVEVEEQLKDRSSDVKGEPRAPMRSTSATKPELKERRVVR